MEKDVVEINGEKLEFYYKRKKIKNLILKVNRNNEIVLSLPQRMPLRVAKEFIKSKHSWIQNIMRKHEIYENLAESKNFKNNEKLYLFGSTYRIKKFASQENKIKIQDNFIELFIKEKYLENSEYIQKMYEKWLREIARNVYLEYVKKYQKITEKYEIPYPTVEIRKMKSRWGECFPQKNKIVFNLSLIKTPKECVEYVVLHELSHFKYQNHGKEFYCFIESFMPDWKERRKILNKEYTEIVI